MVVWKFKLELKEVQIISVPNGARFLDVQYQHGEICVWAIVNSNAHPRPVRFLIAGTGNAISDQEVAIGKMKYFGTVQNLTEAFVWHVFTDGTIERTIS